jgi:hypothetical protein
MKLEIRYRNRFTYDDLVSESHSELRACPSSDAHQRLMDYRVSLAPGAAVVSFVDAWGTRVDAFGIRHPHLTMEILAEATVETSPRPLPAVAVGLDRLSDPAFERDHLEYLDAGRHTTWGQGVTDVARRQVDLSGSDVVGTVLGVHRFVGSHMSYVPGSTEIGVPVEEVLSTRRGVCQDYAHLAVALCRAIRIPARYVSGYLFDETDAVGPGVTATTHAWFEAAIPGWGWLALDPTNGEPAGERHVKIGHGRDYDDVLPLRGAYIGPAGSVAHVEVELRQPVLSDIDTTPPFPRRGGDQ